MSDITPELIQKIATLGRVKLTDQEAQQGAEKIANILDNFSTIQKIDTENIPPADDVSGRVNVTRQDQSKPEVLASHEVLLKSAPETEDNHIKVQAVF